MLIRKESIMEEYRNYEQRHEDYHHHKKFCWLKYLGIICATLLGSFLAFYFVADNTMNSFMSPCFAMKHMNKFDKMVMNDFDRMEKDFNKMDKNTRFFRHHSAVEFIKTPESYKFIVDLTPFQGNTDAVNVDVKDSFITISGEANSNKNNIETFTKMSQTYSLSKNAKVDKLSKKKVDNKYIITIPIED